MQQFDNELTIMRTNISEDNAFVTNSDASPKIVLATINAKFIHASLGLRYLYANLKELQTCCEIKEFVLQTRPL
ncbi:MAG: B12-binding domain-containing radical SAM protein, partial [Psychromonas sp.]